MPPSIEMTKEARVARHRRQTVVGVVTGDAMDKTIRVEVERLVRHPRFEKVLRRHCVCYAHDEKREACRGDRVELAESRPISKSKHWRLVRVLERAAARVPEASREEVLSAPPVAACPEPSSTPPAP